MGANILRDLRNKLIGLDATTVRLDSLEGKVDGLTDSLASIADTMKGLERAVSQKDAKALSEFAHSIRGSAKNLGAKRLADISTQLEDLGRAGSAADAQDLIGKLVAEYKLVESALGRETLPESPRDPIPRDESPQRVLVADDDR